MDNLETEFENKCIDFNLIDGFSQLVVNELCDWANSEIYEPLGGKLIVETPLIDSVNAGACVDSNNPLHPKIKIFMGMIREIYRDSLTFPVYSERLANETSTFSNESWDAFKNASFKFNSGVPILIPDEVSDIGRPYISVWIEEIAEKNQGKDSVRLNAWVKSIAVRFQMFELMIAWTFFHELSHLIQRHYKLKDGIIHKVSFYEIEKSSGKADIDSQAREILADIEGLDLTLKYMERSNMKSTKSLYLLLCAIGCMFNRFYAKSYEINLGSSVTTHPHPVLREEYIHRFIHQRAQTITPYVWERNIRDSLLLGYGYLTTRSSLAVGLYWANKYNSFDGEDYPDYMRSKFEVASSEGIEIQGKLNDSILHQLEKIKKMHLFVDIEQVSVLNRWLINP